MLENEFKCKGMEGWVLVLWSRSVEIGSGRCLLVEEFDDLMHHAGRTRGILGTEQHALQVGCEQHRCGDGWVVQSADELDRGHVDLLCPQAFHEHGASILSVFAKVVAREPGPQDPALRPRQPPTHLIPLAVNYGSVQDRRIDPGQHHDLSDGVEVIGVQASCRLRDPQSREHLVQQKLGRLQIVTFAREVERIGTGHVPDRKAVRATLDQAPGHGSRTIPDGAQVQGSRAVVHLLVEEIRVRVETENVIESPGEFHVADHVQQRRSESSRVRKRPDRLVGREEKFSSRLSSLAPDPGVNHPDRVVVVGGFANGHAQIVVLLLFRTWQANHDRPDSQKSPDSHPLSSP